MSQNQNKFNFKQLRSIIESCIVAEGEGIVTPRRKSVGEPEPGSYAYERKYGKYTAKGELRKKPNPNKPPVKEEIELDETKSAPKGFHFTKDGKLKRGDADVDGPGGSKLRSDPLDKQRSKVPPVSEAKGPAPGYMLKADPALAKKVKEKQDLHKVRAKAMGNPAAGKSIKEEVDDEGAMAKGQLMQMVSQASMLARMMDDNKQLDGWVQSKLTMAADYLDSVHDYLMHNKQDVDSMEEAVNPDRVTTHENPLVTVHNKHNGKWELHTHANLSVANRIFQTNVKHSDVHKGPVEVKSGGSYGNVKFAISKHHASEMEKDKTHNESVEDEHYCAKHVRSGLLGDGVVLEAQHADPDENGNIEWYLVEFKSGIHKVYTEDLEIMIAEYHGNHKKKRMTNGQ